MDLLANNVASKLKKKKLKTETKKMKNTSKSVKGVTSPGKVTKNKKVSKTDKKKILKENLKNLENVNSNKLIKKTDSLKEVLKNKEIKGVKQNKNKKNEQVEKKIDNTVKAKIKRKINETEIVSKKLKKEKKVSEDNKNTSDVSNDVQLSLNQVKKGVTAILKLANAEATSEKSLMADEKLPIFLQVCCIKIPKTPSRQLRMLLPHSLVSPDDDVALIVKDLKKGRRTDYEPTIDHFRQLLDEHKCKLIKTIIPVNQIKTEYDQFELKRNLVNSHDFFLIDGRVSGHVARLLGKTFTKRRKLPTSIRMNSNDLKKEIKYALNKTSMQLNSNGNTQVVQVGTTSMPKCQIVENIEAICKSLTKNYPGGWLNIRALRIKTQKSLAIPIYMTMKNKNEVEAPDVKPKRPKAYKTYEGELTTLPGKATVTVTPDGRVTVKREKDDDDNVTVGGKSIETKIDEDDDDNSEDNDEEDTDD
ncbi:ribosomal L1 domain-containing protein CG13096-like [Leptopilina boulardi]|uniref:ribosomal L1 domain-containing protein CG13096-like n=1 Tax=Leptopilina boulardi TaxID=63433 RepID=UPI0021F61E8D|nr:ribosomal L1 domain-containing protein CG13096-like [Leptopilina boulardi]